MIKSRKFKRPLIDTPNEKAAFRYGIELAASVAADYDRTNSHPYLVSDCILGKLNVLKEKPRKNPDAESFEAALTRLERKIDSLEATCRFMTRHTNFKRSTGVRL